MPICNVTEVTKWKWRLLWRLKQGLRLDTLRCDLEGNLRIHPLLGNLLWIRSKLSPKAALIIFTTSSLGIRSIRISRCNKNTRTCKITTTANNNNNKELDNHPPRLWACQIGRPSMLLRTRDLFASLLPA
jgi:hypothetical protein